MNHVEALVKMAAEHGVKTVRVHAFMDGRDVDPQSGAGYMSEFCAFLAKISRGDRLRRSRCHRLGPLLGHGPR